MEQLHFTPAKGKTQTSRMAAEAAKGSSWRTGIAVLEAIVNTGYRGATDEEVQNLTGLEGSTQRPRRGECAAKGWIVKAPTKRKTNKGRLADVWIATHEGQAALKHAKRVGA